jgi:hypothetical protein
MLLRFWLCEECRTVKRHEVSVWTYVPYGKIKRYSKVAVCGFRVSEKADGCPIAKLPIDAEGIDLTSIEV